MPIDEKNVLDAERVARKYDDMPFAPPLAASGPYELADWVELKALSTDDKNASFQDLVAGLRLSGSTDAVYEDIDTLVDSHGTLSESLVTGVFAEIGERSLAADLGYPFCVKEDYIQLKSNPIDVLDSTYIFQLLVSFLGVDAGKGVRIRPERDFEDISLEAARNYFGRNKHDGNYLFAFPRRTRQKSFPAAVDKLTGMLGEGSGCNNIAIARNRKDDRLDLVVWHGFKDKKPGQLIVFGQCAAGKNWRSKITELPDAGKWCEIWMNKLPLVSPVRMFFIPHRPTEEEWKTKLPYVGIPFERCRIAYHAPKVPQHVASRCHKWMKAALIHAQIW